MTAITARIKDAAYYARKGCRTTTVDYAHIEDAIAEAMAQARAEGFVEGVEAGRSHLRKRACEFEADDMRATARHFRESADVLLKLTPPRPAEGVRPLPPGDLGEALAKAHVPTAEEIDRALAKGREDRRAFVEKAGGFPAGAVAMTEPPKAEATASDYASAVCEHGRHVAHRCAPCLDKELAAEAMASEPIIGRDGETVGRTARLHDLDNSGGKWNAPVGPPGSDSRAERDAEERYAVLDATADALAQERDAWKRRAEAAERAEEQGAIAIRQLGLRCAEAERKRDELRAEVNDMHRRAQKSEGAEQRVERLRRNHEELLSGARNGKRWTIGVLRQRYRDVAEQLAAAGVPDHVDGHPGCKMRRADVLVERLVAQRDELAEALRKVAKKCRNCSGKGFAGTHEVDCFWCRDERAALARLEGK